MNATRLQIAVRTAGDPGLLIQSLAGLIRNKDRNAILADPRPMTSFVDESLKGFRSVMLGLGLFAVLALALAAIGLYGLLAFHVGRRRGEFGIRLAMGATSRDLLRMVLGRGLTLVAAGLVMGLVLAYPGTMALGQLLYETAPLDPGTYLAVIVFLLAVASLACYMPARRVTRIDVAKVLRFD